MYFRSRRWITSWITVSIDAILFLIVVLSTFGTGWSYADETIDFNRDVRPILSDKCFSCHGPDEGQRQTSMRLDRKSSVFGETDSGGSAVVPHQPAESVLFQRLTTEDLGMRMPPVDSDKSISPAEINLIRRWIEQGAPWKEHWSFLAPERPSVPPLDDAGRRWAWNPIDAFVYDRLRREGSEPSARTDKATLIRRVTFDLTGLPPSPADVESFINDRRPDAYARLVDRLLQSPRYGEHRARYWLDAARYGDTHGLHLDNARSIWPYRSWVIRAFNENMPFDQFTVEQLAGDLLPDPTPSQIIATGFNRCNVTTSEGGSIDEEYLVRYAVDRVETTSTVWMGLTAGCAACHDHKFDPLSQKEFYELFAFYFNLTERAMDGNALLPPPSLKAAMPWQKKKERELQQQLHSVRTKLEQIRTRADDAGRLAQWISDYRTSEKWTPLPVDTLLYLTLDSQDSLAVQAATDIQSIGNPQWTDGRVDLAVKLDGKAHLELPGFASFTKRDPFSFAAWLKVQNKEAMALVSKMDDRDANRGYDVYLSEGKVYVHLISHWEQDAIRVNTTEVITPDQWHHVAVTYDGSATAKGISIYIDGVRLELEITHDQLSGSITTDQPLRIGQRRDAASFQGSIDELRVYARPLPAEQVRALSGGDAIDRLVSKQANDWTASERQKLLDHFLADHEQPYRQLSIQRAALELELQQLQSSFPATLVMEETDERRQAHLLIRGEYDNKGEPVSPDVPAVLPPLPPDASRDRLGLARWLVNPEHPLTARVTVNRFWQHYFGTGFVKTSEDFGSQAEWPSHPKLLDWLAVELIDSGWDLKWLQRLIVTSATYQQSSAVGTKAYQRDPENRLLARGPRYRMDAEIIRDNALAVSGLLVTTMGGPSVKPYQPKGLWKAVGYTSSNTANFKRDSGADLYRRSLYTFWKRTSPPPSMQIFDVPSREVCAVRRPRTNTPMAALVLMNDQQFVEAARHLATRILDQAKGSSDQGRLRYGFRLATSRHPNSVELQTLQRLLDAYRNDYSQDALSAEALLSVGESPMDQRYDADELAAWTMVASTLLNLDETITKQ